MRLLVSTLLALALCVPGILTAGTVGPFCENENDGIIIIDAESASTDGTGWSTENNIAGYGGSGYVRFANSSSFGGPQGVQLEYTFEIKNEGWYYVSFRSRKDNSTSDLDNDTWIQIDNEGFTKCFTTGNPFVWTWETVFEPHHGSFEFPPYRRYMTAGEHRIQFSGRSQHHRIDRIAIWREGIDGALAQDINAPQSGDCTPPEPTEWTLDFTGSKSNNWSYGTAPGLLAPTGTSTDRGLCIKGDPSFDGVSFGFWTGVLDDVQLESGAIYEFAFVVSTDIDVTTRHTVPTVRVRVNDGSFQSGVTLNVESEGNLELVPTAEGKLFRLYKFVPEEINGNQIHISFDWLWTPHETRLADTSVYLSEVRVRKVE